MAAVVNPAARGGRAGSLWRRAEARLAGLGLPTDTLLTRRPGDGVRLAAEAVRSGVRTILAVGGDGTVHEVVNGIDQAEGLPFITLGVIPAGTGMDFVRNASLPRTIRSAVDAIAAGETHAVDLGMSQLPEQKLFVNFAETGLGASVVAREAAYAEGWPGRTSYLLAAVGTAVQGSITRATIAVDGEPVFEGPLVSAVVANGRYFGAGMKIAPRASVADGLLDVMILGDFSRAQLLAQIWKIYPGVHLSHPKVRWLRGKEITIEPSTVTRLDLDGELSGPGPYRFSVLPGALRVIGRAGARVRRW